EAEGPPADEAGGDRPRSRPPRRQVSARGSARHRPRDPRAARRVAGRSRRAPERLHAVRRPVRHHHAEVVMTLILSRSDVHALLTLRDCIAAVEQAFALHADGKTLGPGVLGVPVPGGGFHVKAAGLVGARRYFAAKTNANFPENLKTFGRPTIQGTVVLFDARHGEPLAVMDSGSITALRTGAATAVAAKYLARPESRVATVVGCGVQGEIQLAAIAAVLPL